MKEAFLIKNKTYSKRDVLIRGIYFLILNKKIVYVGKASNSILERVLRHVTEDYKIFDSFQFVNCNKLSKSELNNLEIQYIRKHKPEYNKNYMIMNKTKRLELRLTTEQHKHLKELAGQAKMSMAEWLIAQSGLDATGTLDDAPQLCKDIDNIVRTKEKEEGNVRTSSINVRTKPAELVATNVPTKEKASIVNKGASIKTISKALNKQMKSTKYQIRVDTEQEADEILSSLNAINRMVKADENKPHPTCASCSAKIKKGFLCPECLK